MEAGGDHTRLSSTGQPQTEEQHCSRFGGLWSCPSNRVFCAFSARREYVVARLQLFHDCLHAHTFAFFFVVRSFHASECCSRTYARTRFFSSRPP